MRMSDWSSDVCSSDLARKIGAVAARAGGGGADGRGRSADAGIPAAVGRAQPVADVRQLDLPGPPLPAPPDAVAGTSLPLPQPRREHDQGARAALGAGGTGGGAQGGVAYRAERRARLDRGGEALPDGDGRVRRAALTRLGPARKSTR